MSEFGVIVADPPWSFDDRLTMSDVKRGADANYDTLTMRDIEMLPIVTVAADACLLALWCPKSMLEDGIAIMSMWGWDYKTFYTWVKRTKNGKLGFGMGRLFRAASEVALIGTRGKLYGQVANKSQRDVAEALNLGHSTKPECLQDSLDLMFPTEAKLELFARRVRPGWTCTGWECPGTEGEDVRETLRRLRV